MVSQAEAAGDISGDRAGTTVRHSAEDPSPQGTAPLEVWGGECGEAAPQRAGPDRPGPVDTNERPAID